MKKYHHKHARSLKDYMKHVFDKLFWQRRREIRFAIAAIFVALVGFVGFKMLTGSEAAITSEIIFPADANIANVKLAPYNAKGDGVTDDTAALRLAITTNDNETAVFRSAPKTVYLPKGTYLVSDSILADNSSVRVVGAGAGNTIIKLKDNAAGYGDSQVPKYVMKSGNADRVTDLANSGFSNYFQDLTVDVGAGNPGAVGIRHDVANTGAMQRVTIKAAAGSGKYGLAYETSAGPALNQDVTIEGFEYGVYLDRSNMNVITFEDLLVRNQRIGGILNDSKNIVLENFTSENNQVAIRTVNSFASVMIIGGTLSGKGTGPAIDIPVKGFLHARDITTSGYSNIITIAGSNKFVGKTTLKEWSTENYRVGNTSKVWTEDNDYVSLRLPIKKAPTYESNDFSKWASVKVYGATPGTGETDLANNDDDGPAIQKAIDSGAEVVYFPYGFYNIKSDVIVRGNVKKIDFMFSRVANGSRARFLIEAVNGDSVILENVSCQVPFVHKSPDTVVIRNLNSTGGGISTDTGATGDLFSENNGSHAHLDINHPINIWVRSMDRTNVDWVNNGGTLWVLSSNVESDMSHTISTGGAKTEILGGTLDSLFTTHPVDLGAVFQSDNSYMSVFMPGTLRQDSTRPSSWDYLVHDKHSEGATDLYDGNLIKFTAPTGFDTKFAMPIYVTPGYVRPTTPPPTADTSPPSVQLTSPLQGATVSGTISVNATASDNISVTKVELLVDGVLKYTDTSSPYSFSWNSLEVSDATHSLTVKAYDASANTNSASINLTVQNGDKVAPSAPANLAITSKSSSQVSMTWTASTDNVGVTGYWLIRNGVTIAQLGKVTSYTDGTVSPSTAYSYQLKAIDAAGNVSAASNTASVTTSAAPDTTAPSTPGSLTATAASSSQINLSWTASTDNIGVTGYDVYRNNTKIITVATTSFGDTGLNAGTAYSYYVVAKDAAGNSSAMSTVVSATTLVATVNSAVVKGVVTNASGDGIAYAKATFALSTNAATKQIVTTDSTGRYATNNLAPGNYTIKYSSSKGYLSKTIYLSIPSTGGTFTSNVTLEKR